MKIAIDFDGTVVTHDYPQVGEDIGAVPVLKKLVQCGHKIILFTMRSGKQLQDAIDWYNNNEIPLYGVNIDPTQSNWTASNKAYANLYIDDCGLNIPLIQDVERNTQYVDWVKVEQLLKERNIIYDILY